ncbi:hypothetical protein SRABI106_04114 [Rahnella aquatilis]|nr:hypothetical protein SRABI106_04114 [Rahnella aquatilis]
MTGIKAEGRAAVLPQHAAARQHHATAELVINALDKRNRQPAAVHHAHPDGIARPFTFTPVGGAVWFDAGRKSIEILWIQQFLCILRHHARIGDKAIAQTERQFGGFHHAVNGGTFVHGFQRQTVSQAEDRQRNQSLRRGCQVVDFAFTVFEPQRHTALWLVSGEIGAGHRHAELFHVGGHIVGQLTAIETVQPVLAQHR